MIPDGIAHKSGTDPAIRQTQRLDTLQGMASPWILKDDAAQIGCEIHIPPVHPANPSIAAQPPAPIPRNIRR